MMDKRTKRRVLTGWALVIVGAAGLFATSKMMNGLTLLFLIASIVGMMLTDAETKR